MTVDRILRVAEVAQLVGLSPSSIFRQSNAGTFPRQVLISAQNVGWRLSEVQAWIESRPARVA